MLILDETIDRKGVIERPGVPKVSRVSDVHPVRVMHFKSGPAVCIDVSQGRWTCGLRIEDGQVAWSVLFDAERLQDADLIRNEARNLVREYKVGR